MGLFSRKLERENVSDVVPEPLGPIDEPSIGVAKALLRSIERAIEHDAHTGNNAPLRAAMRALSQRAGGVELQMLRSEEAGTRTFTWLAAAANYAEQLEDPDFAAHAFYFAYYYAEFVRPVWNLDISPGLAYDMETLIYGPPSLESYMELIRAAMVCLDRLDPEHVVLDQVQPTGTVRFLREAAVAAAQAPGGVVGRQQGL